VGWKDVGQWSRRHLTVDLGDVGTAERVGAKVVATEVSERKKRMNWLVTFCVVKYPLMWRAIQ
jgi:hypothetical protein